MSVHKGELSHPPSVSVMECTDEGCNGGHLDHAFEANGVMDALYSSALS